MKPGNHQFFSPFLAGLIGLTLLLISAAGALAQTTNTWTGQTGSDWNTAANWSRTAVPGTGDDVVIPAGTTSSPLLSTTAVAKSVEVQSGASLTISTTGSLSINGFKYTSGPSSGFYNSGQVRNEGQLILGNTGSVGLCGLYNVSSFTNTAGGIIRIDRADNYGLGNNMNGSFVNSATIIIGSGADAGGVGLYNTASFTNTAAGSIQIDRTSSYGLSNEVNGSFVNSATIIIGSGADVVGVTGLYNTASFTNTAAGSIQIDRTSSYGLYTIGSFVNSATITIGTGIGGGFANGGLFTSSSFSNLTGGNISIDRINGTAIYNSAGSFVNQATITIGASATGNAIGNFGVFDNQGCQALINSLGNTYIINFSSFSNTGTIIERSSGSSNISYNGGLVQDLNGGNFSIGSGNAVVTSAGLFWRGCVSSDWNTPANWSAGTLPTATDDVTIPAGTAYSPVLSTTAVANSVEVQPGASFTISSSGSLTISGAKSMTINSSSYTIAFFNSGTVVNQGALSAGNTAEVGLWNESFFSNLAGGSMTIDGTSSQALANNAGTFVNQATIRIGSIAGAGLYGIQNSASFTNTTGGLIQIDNTTVYGLFCQDGSFVNSATITIGSVASTGTYGLQNKAFFTNKTGGFIDINLSNASRLVNDAPGTFVNQATITIGSVHPAAGTGLTNASSFSNIPGGSIIINRSAIALANDGSFLNAASIAIGTLPGAGLYGLSNSASFSNVAGGNIAIDRISDIGLSNGAGFVNSATITIGTLSETALAYGLSNSSSFSNLTGGSITIDHSTTAALSHTYNTFVNQATITIGTNATGFAISTGGVFTNQGCQALINSLGNAIINNGSSFSNTGTIIERSSNNSSISYNGGLVQNLNGGTFAIATGQPPLSVSATGLTTCNPANGSFTIAGVQPATAYTLSYTVGNATASLALTGNGAGQLSAANLSGGTYALALSGSCVAQTLPLSATLSAPSAFTLTTQPPATSVVCAGAAVSATVGVSGTTAPVTYQWYKNTLASPVASQTAATLSLTNLTSAESGSYFVVITDNCSSATSTAFSLTVNTISSFTVSSATVCPGQSVNLTASGCGGQILWSTGATTAIITLTAGSSTSLLTATCTAGVCSATATGQVVVGGIQPPPAQILSFTADESACPVRLTGRGVASSFTMTGPKDYVFSTVYREGATHEAIGLNVKQAGTYTLTATYTNSCGTSAPVTRTVAVSKSCP